jgi:hypothetical protein
MQHLYLERQMFELHGQYMTPIKLTAAVEIAKLTAAELKETLASLGAKGYQPTKESAVELDRMQLTDLPWRLPHFG